MFSSDSDDIQSVTNFSDVEFDKFIASSNFNAEELDIGGAFKFGSIFLSPWYSGNFGSESSNSEESLSRTNTYSSYDLTGYTTTENDYLMSYKKLDNDFSLLFGIGNVGIKAGFADASYSYKGTLSASSTSSTSSTTFIYDEDGNLISSSGTEYDGDGYYKYGYYTPSIEAGTSLKAGGFTLKPFVGLGVNVISYDYDYSNKNTATPSSNTIITDKDYTDDYTILLFKPEIGISAELPQNGGSKFLHTVSFEYTPTFYSYGDSNLTTLTTKSGTFDTDTTIDGTSYSAGDVYYYKNESGNDYKERSCSYNDFALGYKMEYKHDDRLTLAWNGNVAFSIYDYAYNRRSVSESYESLTDLYGNTTIEESYAKGVATDYEDFKFTATPIVNVGMKYQLVPSKLDINLGGTINLPKFSYESTSTKYPEAATTYTKNTAADGTVTETTTASDASRTNSEKETCSWSSVTGSAALGLTWYLSENVYLDSDLTLGITKSDDSTSSSVFSSTWYIGVTLKY